MARQGTHNRLRAGLPTTWVIGDKTGNNGVDAAGDIDAVRPESNVPIVVCVYTRGGAPSATQVESAYASIGLFVGAQTIHSTCASKQRRYTAFKIELVIGRTTVTGSSYENRI